MRCILLGVCQLLGGAVVYKYHTAFSQLLQTALGSGRQARNGRRRRTRHHQLLELGRAQPDHAISRRRLLLTRRARHASGTATQCTRRNDSPPPGWAAPPHPHLAARAAAAPTLLIHGPACRRRPAWPERPRGPGATASISKIIEAPWLVNGGHGASLRQHVDDKSQ
jgi:hypothetical protein